jgi:hypothetical protein
MARISNEQRLLRVHDEAMREFDTIQAAVRDERIQCLEDRRFYSIAGAQWEGGLGEQFENKPRMEVNKVHLAVIRIINEYRNNRITVDFVDKEGDEKNRLADVCDGLYRADEQDSGAEEAYDNAFEEAVGGGFGAWRVCTDYESEEDPDDDRQRIKFEPIYDADSSVFFDLNSKRQDKGDAKSAYVLTSMSRDAYASEWGEDYVDMPKEIIKTEFDWATPDVVYIAEYYKVEEVNDKIYTYTGINGEERKIYKSELEEEDDLIEELAALGFNLTKEKRIKKRKVHKYIINGAKVLEDCGYIAGKCIPIVPVYGKRWFVDNIERCMGHVRLAKDAQRLKNMQLSKLAEISALSSIEKPILTPEQVAGHQIMWAEDNIKDYPYLLINPITAPNGESIASGPVGYTKSPQIPPAMAALLQITEQDMQDLLGNQQNAEDMVSNISGKAVELIQQRLDMQAFIYMSNMAKAVKRCGEIWLSMARDVYVEEGRKLKSIGTQGEMSSVELMRPVDADGETEFENDLSAASFDVAVDVGPSSMSKRQSTVRNLMNMISVTQDPQTKQVLESMAMMNMEGEGIADVRDYFRGRLIRMGVVKPTKEETEQMAAEAANAKPDANTQYLQAAAEEATAKATKARADTVLTIAKAEETQAKTMETLANIGQAESQPMQQAQAQQAPQPAPMSDIDREKAELELENLRIETKMKMRNLEKVQAEAASVETQNNAVAELAQTSENIKMAAGDLSESVKGFQSAIVQLTQAGQKQQEKALEALSRPKKIIREKGKIVGIE